METFQYRLKFEKLQYMVMTASTTLAYRREISLYWTPRIMAIIGLLLMSVFAFDVFGEGYSATDLIIALTIHLIPSIIITLSLIIAWQNELLGGIIFNSLAIFSTIFFNTYESIPSFILLTLPFIIIGELFLYHWYHTPPNT